MQRTSRTWGGTRFAPLGAALAAAGVLLHAAGCGGAHTALAPATLNAAAPAPPGRAAAPPAVVRETAGFTLRVLPVTGFEAGQLGEPALTVHPAADGTTEVLVNVAGAQRLKALYLEIGYDPARYDPVSAAPTTALADSAGGAASGAADRTLTLNVLGQPGTVAVNQVLTLPLAQPGFTGSGTLARVVFAGRPFTVRQASAAPISLKSASTVSLNSATREMTWNYHSQGDYDQNGETNGSDLTPIALHYKVAHSGGGSFDEPSVESAVDGDDNGEINGADIQAIAQNYKRVVDGYHVYTSVNLSDVPVAPADPSTLAAQTDVLLTAAAGDPKQERLAFTYTFPALANQAYVWVRPFNGATEGTASNAPQYTAPNIKPVAALTTDKQSGSVPLVVTLDGSTSHDPDGTITKYEFDWDGQAGGLTFVDNGATPSVQHSYDTIGSYTPVLRVTDNNGATATFALTAPIVVSAVAHTPPTASLSASPLGGPTPLNVSFDASASSDSDGTITQYEWDFDGDGTYDETGASATTNHTYNAEGSFFAKVRVTDNDTLSATATKHIVVSNTPIDPVAQFTATKYTGEAPLDDDFDASASYDPDGTITLYEWDWNYDGVTFNPMDSSPTPLFSHTFAAAANYKVALRVTDNSSAKKIATATVKVLPAGNYNPVALLLAAPRYGPAPLTVTFDASGSSDFDGTIDHYDWDWDGDGTYDLLNGTNTLEQHVFNTPGTFNTQVRVTDDDGLQSTKIMLVLVTPDSSFPPVDSIFALPSQSKAHDGDVVTIEVYTRGAANAFQFMSGSSVTMEQGNTYAPLTFNIGAISFDPQDQSVDGVWTLVGPSGGFLLAPDNFYLPSDVGGGRVRYDFNITPLGGADIANATGPMFSFGLTVHSNVSLGFLHDEPPFKRTYYASDAMESFWGTDNNAGLPGITLLP